MLGLLIVTVATFVNEIGTAIGKRKTQQHQESIYTMGFLNLLWGTIFLGVLAFAVPKDIFAPGFPGGFVFAAASLPTFLPRLLLEIVQLHVTLRALTIADRSTFGFLRIITIPLLLSVDIFLGYSIGAFQIIGVGLIVMSLVFLFINHGIRKKGAFLVLFTAGNAVITISLFKYNITHFNSVEAEQSLVMIVLLIYCLFLARFRAGENPLRFLFSPIFLLQSLAKGAASVGLSFAFLFAPASILTTGQRSLSILWSVLSGNMYFHEKRLVMKLVSFALIVAGLVLLTF